MLRQWQAVPTERVLFCFVDCAECEVVLFLRHEIGFGDGGLNYDLWD